MSVQAPHEEMTVSAKRPGEEPLPGYRLISPLGRGGFGEVWKCEAPGGLHKAVKFVASDEANHSLRQEYEAFQQIKAIRHPFLLQLERVELTATELIMVMELADSQLQDRFLECRAAGPPGIPRDELLAYLADAAEALDVISVKHGLQHLDVKPANLFIICGRVKVGDYGLVRAENNAGAVNNRGFTPRYVAPEVLRGRVDPRSDQYSLALVYQELLTGVFPYTGRTAQHMMMLHSTGTPDLSSLPPEDQGPVSIALAKQPEHRFPSCLDFIRALMVGPSGGTGGTRHDTFKPHDTTAINAARLSRVQAASGYLARPGSRSDTVQAPAPLPPVHTPMPYVTPAPLPTTPLPYNTPAPLNLINTPVAYPASARLTTVGSRGIPMPASPPPTPPPAPPIGPSPFGRSQALTGGVRSSIVPEEPVHLVAQNSKIRLTDGLLKSVLPVSVLTGQAVVPAAASGDWFVTTLMNAVIGETDPLGRTSAGTWVFRFRSTHPMSVARHKLDAMLSEDWFDEIRERGPTVIQCRRFAKTAGLFGRFSSKKSGLEVDIIWPAGRGGEVELSASLFNDPDEKFTHGMAGSMPHIFNEIRNLLRAGDERRKDPRVPVNLPVNLYPLKDDGEILAPIGARSRNVSSGGICMACSQPLPTRYAYIEFPEVHDLQGVALLTKLIRSQPNGAEHLFAGKFRTNIS